MLPRDEAVTYHQTTRNLFAWIMNKPLVGSSLGKAMISLLERMLQVRSATKSNLDDCITYAERMGYMDMADQPSHAGHYRAQTELPIGHVRDRCRGPGSYPERHPPRTGAGDGAGGDRGDRRGG